MEMALKEEMKVIYNSPKSFRGEKSPRKHPSEVVGNLPVILNTTLKCIMTGSQTLDKG